MPGVSNVCRRIDKTGLQLANKKLLDTRRDTLDIDLLIGNDLVYQLVNWDQKPRRLFGQFLFSTHYGWAPTGPVPLSRRSMGKQNVHLLVANIYVLNPNKEIE